jgi:hypothetical protein
MAQLVEFINLMPSYGNINDDQPSRPTRPVLDSNHLTAGPVGAEAGA